MRVAEAIGSALVVAGVDIVFGVVGSGNYRTTSAMVSAGARFVASRHENGATTMADSYSRLAGRVPAVTVHQGPGFTNTITGLVEAHKSHTPLVLIAPDTPDARRTSNFWLDQVAVVRALGIEVVEVVDARHAAHDAWEAVRRARHDRRPVVLDVSTELLEAEYTGASPSELGAVPNAEPVPVGPDGLEELARRIHDAERPVFIAGRGAIAHADLLMAVAERGGALLATSAVARGLFSRDPWSLDVSGGFATPLAVELITGADLVVAWGAALNRWTTLGRALLRTATVVQVDDRPEAFGLHGPSHFTVRGDVGVVGASMLDLLARDDAGYRTPDIRARIAAEGDWRLVPFEDTSTEERVDPRAVTVALDAILPPERTTHVDGGNFNGYPSVFLGAPDRFGFTLPLAFQSIGLGLAAAIGGWLARPDAVSIAGVGDGGFMMSLVELDTAVRLGCPLVVIVYNDDAYGAEVHHFLDDPVGDTLVRFPETDIAEIARGFGCDAVTIRGLGDVDLIRGWVEGRRDRPLVIDAKITSFASWVLAHTFEGE